jgi:hypothetical protein
MRQLRQTTTGLERAAQMRLYENTRWVEGNQIVTNLATDVFNVHVRLIETPFSGAH